MYFSCMLHIRLTMIGIFFLCSSVNSLTTGRVNNTRLTSIDLLNKDAIWMSNIFTTWSQCVCAVLSSNYSSTAVALNIYRNGSCQLFNTLPITYTLEINYNSTLILFKTLPSKSLAPCCSNISWLINQINNSLTSTKSIYHPAFLTIDDNNLLAMHSYKGDFYQLNRSTLSTVQTVSTYSVTGFGYRNGLYYIADCPSACTIKILSTKNLSLVGSISLSSIRIREITFVRNGSLMLIAGNSDSKIYFYNVISTNTYTPSTPSSISVTQPCGLHVVNDSFIYVTSWATSTPVYTLIFTNNTWSIIALPNTTTSSAEQTFQTTIDSCGRLWVSIVGFGIRIFDPWGRTLLYSWPVTSNPNGFLLLDNYEFFVTDFQNNQVYRYNPNINQCTS